MPREIPDSSLRNDNTECRIEDCHLTTVVIIVLGMLSMRSLRFGTLLPFEDPSLSFPLFPFLPTLRNLDTYLTHTIRVWIAIEGNNMSKAQWRAVQSPKL